MGVDKSKRSRTWWVLLYPDDLPSDYINMVETLGVPTLISPLHDRDVYEKDSKDGKYKKGDPKKVHRHCMFMFGSKKSAKQLQDMLGDLFGLTAPNEQGKCSIIGVASISDREVVTDRNAAARYMLHLDQPKKAQYSRNDMVALNGADIDTLLHRTVQETQTLIKEIMDFVVENDITDFCVLADSCARYNPDWFTFITTKGTYFLREYVRSRHFRKQTGFNPEDAIKPLIDPRTGEVLNAEELGIIKTNKNEQEEDEQDGGEDINSDDKQDD